MAWFDWLILIIPVAIVMGIGIHSRKYMKSISDFLSAGRICNRYLISVCSIAQVLSIVGLISSMEANYKTGFALTFWSSRMTMPMWTIIGLSGYCFYRFRETRAMSIGQFLEMRYSRGIRIYAAALRSLSEMLANMIMPAIAARFFISFLDLPEKFSFFGVPMSTFHVIIVICLVLAITLICMGGTLALVITDSLQGMILYPLMALFTIFILVKFPWNTEIVPVMMDRAPGESFINPMDIEKLRDFNLFLVITGILGTILNYASWTGAGNDCAAKSPHEQKMAGLLGTWRGALNTVFFLLLAVMLITVMNHKKYAPLAREIRNDLSTHIAREVVPLKEKQDKLIAQVSALPEQIHEIGVDEPLSEKNNLDSKYLEKVHENLLADSNEETGEDAQGNARFQKFRTLYYQLLLPSTMRHLLPPGMIGLFCLLLVMAMISTDDTRIYSATLTITQDVILPFKKKGFTIKQHVLVIRLVAIAIGVFFFCGSSFMAQLDYINLFVAICCSIWCGGAGPVIVFGLYSRFGTTAGAWTSLLSGMIVTLVGMFTQRNWADVVYPFLDKHQLVESVAKILDTITRPFQPYIVWEMNPVKCPINSYEIYFFTMLITLVLYVVVSKLTLKKPFNLDRMLHRGIYDTENKHLVHEKLTIRNIVPKMIGITSEYTLGDKILAWVFFLYSFGYQFVLAFVVVLIWNMFSPWSVEWWSKYFFIVALFVPCILAIISAFWFGIGGYCGMVEMFKALKNRVVNPLDDGRVEGNVSLEDKAILEEREKTQEK